MPSALMVPPESVEEESDDHWRRANDPAAQVMDVFVKVASRMVVWFVMVRLEVVAVPAVGAA